MKIERVPLPETALQRSPALASDRTLAVALVLSALFWVMAWYWQTAYSMISIWRHSDTFAHGFLVVPISAWLIWRRRHVVAALEFRPDYWALPVMAVVGAGWLLGWVAGVMAAQQFALVLMIPLAVWAILGRRVLRALAFPLLFLLLAVPFGEFLEPVLMLHTADFTVAALRLTGIPVYREGQFFVIPSGSWSVVEACSGFRYLIASVTVGILYAYLTYRTRARRVAFVAASIVVPIVANWLRAYMIVMIGHLSDMKYAVGVDHLLYGWLFFGVVMLLLFWVGSFWREDLDPPQAERPMAKPLSPAGAFSLPLGAILAATVAVAVVSAAWPVAAERSVPDYLAAPQLQVPPGAGGWQPIEGRLSDWTPSFMNPRATVSQVYRSGDRVAVLYVGYYRNQGPGSQLISYTNTLVSQFQRNWRIVASTRGSRAVGGAEIPVVDTTLVGMRVRLLVSHWYWMDGTYLVNHYWAKVVQAWTTLLGRGDDGAVIIVYAPYSENPREAEKVLQDFVSAMLPSITRTLENARGTPPSH